MSTTTAEHSEHSAHDDHAEHGLSVAGYIKVAIVLAALTALEVATYFVDFGPFFMPVLLILMCVKFFIVVSYFMHLKFDKPILTRIFYSGLVLAMLVYLAMLTTFRIWF